MAASASKDRPDYLSYHGYKFMADIHWRRKSQAYESLSRLARFSVSVNALIGSRITHLREARQHVPLTSRLRHLFDFDSGRDGT